MTNIVKSTIFAMLYLLGNSLVGQVVSPQNTEASIIAEIKSIHGADAGNSIKGFLDNLKLYSRESNKCELSKMIEFPIWVTHHKKQLKIKDEKTFALKYAKIMNKKILSAIESASIENLFVNHNGIMINRGEVWISCVIDERDPKQCGLKIIRLNN
ncbi:MAG: hypothetical protein Q8O00_05265 [Holophaga sp.]|nr:hypothetical protein [Holophaga sp.]